MQEFSKEMLEYLFKHGGISLNDVLERVSVGKINTQDFKEITGLNYQGVLANKAKKMGEVF